MHHRARRPRARKKPALATPAIRPVKGSCPLKDSTAAPHAPSPMREAIAASILAALEGHTLGYWLHNIDSGTKRWAADLSELVEALRGTFTRSEIRTALDSLVKAELIVLWVNDGGVTVILPTCEGSADE
jgi:hypothetical protein